MNWGNIVVIDLETSGLDPHRHGILEIGAVKLADRSEFHADVRLRETDEVSAGALKVNGIDAVEVHSESRMPLDAALAELLLWLGSGEWIIAGMNPRFDREFLVAGLEALGFINCFCHRTLDLHSVALAVLAGRGHYHGQRLTTGTIYRALGLPEEPKPHRALTGAKMEARAFRLMFWQIAHAFGQAQLVGMPPRVAREFADETPDESHRAEANEGRDA